MSSNLVSANNLAVNNNLTVNGTITGSNNISTTSNIQGANITATSNVNATNVNLTGQLNGLTLNNLNSLDTTSSIQTQLNNITGKQTSDENNITTLLTKTTPLTYNSPNLGIFNTSPTYPLDISASTYRIGPVAQINSNGTMALVNSSCASDPANFALYQGVNGDTVLNCGLNETIEFKVHNNQVCMLNSTGIGVGNGNPQHQIDVTGVISASSDVLINGNSVNTQLNNSAKLNGNNTWTNNNTFSDGITANSISLYNNTSYSDLNQRLLGDEQNIASVTNTANNNQINLGGLQTTVTNLLPFTIKACGHWNGSTGETTNGYLCQSASYGTHWLSAGLTGIQFVLNSNIQDIQGIIFTTPDTNGYVCQAHCDNVSSPFTFVVQMLSAGSSATVTGQQNVQFFWMVI